ncbi:MAG: hypothetical protein WC114_11010 [Smithellaceae bacterium]|jgi:hypothetical protein
MTKAEFETWLAYHRAAFTGLSQWIAKLPDPGSRRASDGEPHRLAVLAAWYAAMRDCDPADARVATDRMAGGLIEEPKGWDRHKTSIAQEARRLASERNRHQSAGAWRKPRFAGGEPTYRCLECHDSGIIPIWHPDSVTAACMTLDGDEANGLGQPFTIYEAAARCPCGAGSQYRHLPHYDAGVFCRLEVDAPSWQRVDALLAWTEQHRKIPVHDCFAPFAGEADRDDRGRAVAAEALAEFCGDDAF